MFRPLLCGISICAAIAAGVEAAPVAQPADSTLKSPASFTNEPNLTLNTTPLMLAEEPSDWDARAGDKLVLPFLHRDLGIVDERHCRPK